RHAVQRVLAYQGRSLAAEVWVLLLAYHDPDQTELLLGLLGVRERRDRLLALRDPEPLAASDQVECILRLGRGCAAASLLEYRVGCCRQGGTLAEPVEGTGEGEGLKVQPVEACALHAAYEIAQVEEGAVRVALVHD